MDKISLIQRLNSNSENSAMAQLADIQLNEVLQPLCSSRGDSYLMDIYYGCIRKVLKDETTFAEAVTIVTGLPEKAEEEMDELLYRILIEPFL